ncbi:hypothetical protein [Azospirillum doebereinerae]
MAIDATSIDSGAVQRAAVPRERTSPVISDGHNGGPVEIRGDMSFWDFLDVINPLQHIPIVSTIYRNVTGDTIQPAARVMGGMLYGGPLGGMAAIANAVVEEAQGKDIPDQIMTALGFEGGDHPTGSVAVADASGGSASAASPADPFAARAASQAADGPAGSPVKLGAATSGSTAEAAGAAGVAASPSLAAQLAAGSGHGGGFTGGKMPARDTPLASSTMVKHSVPKFAAPLPGSVPVNTPVAKPGTAQAANANPTPAANANGSPSPEPLSETMMRNLAKYEQSRKAAQSAAPAVRVSS